MRFGVRVADFIVGALCIALALYVLLESSELEAYREGVPGPGFFPMIVAAALFLCGVLLIATRLRRTSDDEDDGEETITAPPLLVWLLLLISVGLTTVLGFVVTMVLVVAVLLLGLERQRNIAALATIALVPTLAYWLFAVVLGVPLPTGIFGI